LESEFTTKDAQRDPKRGLSVAAALKRCAELGALQSGRRNPGGLRESDLEHQRLHLKKKALHAELRHYDGHDYMAEKRWALDVMVKKICKTAASGSRSETLQRHRKAFGRARLLARRRPSTVAADAQPIALLG